MMMKKMMVSAAVLGALTTGALATQPANAMSTNIQGTQAYKNQPAAVQPSIIANQTALNSKLQMNYDDDTLTASQKAVVKAAGDSWNKALGRDVIESYQARGISKSQADLVITAQELDPGVGGVTWVNGSYAEGKQAQMEIAPYSFDPAKSLPNQMISTVRHEMGHALGLNHDVGDVMGPAAETKLAHNILPNIPDYNVNAVLNNMKSISQLNNKTFTQPYVHYSNKGDLGTAKVIKPFDVIGMERFDPKGTNVRLTTRTSTTHGTLTPSINQNVYEIGNYGGTIGTTNSLGITGKPVELITTYKTNKGGTYYQIRVGGNYYFIDGYYINNVSYSK